MKFPMNFIQAARALVSEIKNNRTRYFYCQRHIIAQWVFESGWGRSGLARQFNNFGGMRWRDSIAYDLSADDVLPALYTDWQGVTTKHFLVKRPENYQKIYFRFIERPRYKDVRTDTGEHFLHDLAAAGYVASMRSRGGNLVPPETIPDYYTERICEIVNGKTFADLYYQVEIPDPTSALSKKPIWLAGEFTGPLKPLM